MSGTPVWRYKRKAKFSHALPFPKAAYALCGGAWANYVEEWLGDGSDKERETLAATPKCRHCLARVTGQK